MSDELTTALEHLPHGPEFRFVDRLLSLDRGKSGTAVYQVRGDESFLRGHFPSAPLFPGVLLVEAAAQLAGVVAQSDPERIPLEGLKLTALQGAKIYGTARPGDIIDLAAKITGRLGGLVQATASARIADKIILQAELTLSGTQPSS